MYTGMTIFTTGLLHWQTSLKHY